MPIKTRKASKAESDRIDAEVEEGKKILDAFNAIFGDPWPGGITESPSPSGLLRVITVDEN